MQQALFPPIIHTRYYSHQIEGGMHGFVPHMNKRFEDIIKTEIDKTSPASQFATINLVTMGIFAILTLPDLNLNELFETRTELLMHRISFRDGDTLSQSQKLPREINIYQFLAYFFSSYNTDRFFDRGITLSMCFNQTNRRLCKVNHRNGHRIISKRVLIIFKILQHNDTLWIPFSRHLKPFL